MNKTILHINNIKTYTKSTKEIIPVDLKHTKLLNQLAISLGFRNYFTLKGIADKNDGYIEVSIKNDDISQIVKKRFEAIDKDIELILKKFNYPVDSVSSSLNFFLTMQHQIIEVASKSLRTFSFIDYNSFDSSNIFNKYISIEYFMYFYFLSIKFNVDDIKEYLNSYFAYGNHSLKKLEQEFNKRKHLMYSFDLFVLELKSLEILTDSMIQHHSYAQQQWTLYGASIPINNKVFLDKDGDDCAYSFKEYPIDGFLKRYPEIIVPHSTSINKTNVINIFGATGSGKTTLIKALDFDKRDTLIITFNWDTNYKDYKNVFYIDKKDHIALIKELDKKYKTIVFENLYDDYLFRNNLNLQSLMLSKRETIFVISTQTQIFIKDIKINSFEIKANSIIEENKKLFFILASEFK